MKRISGSVKVSREPLQKQALPDKRTDDPESEFQTSVSRPYFEVHSGLFYSLESGKRCLESPQRYFR